MTARRIWMNVTSALVAACALQLTAAASAATPSSGEIEVRTLEQTQARAAVAGDTATLERIFSADYQMVNPAGQITTREQLLKLLTGATHPYRSATYTTDLVRDLGNVIVTIGREDVVPNQGAQAGQVVHRRVTQVWVRDHGTWRLSIRHAMVVPPA
jgi:uncharacterized protein (TIGR02246 family)